MPLYERTAATRFPSDSTVTRPVTNGLPHKVSQHYVGAQPRREAERRAIAQREPIEFCVGEFYEIILEEARFPRSGCSSAVWWMRRRGKKEPFPRRLRSTTWMRLNLNSCSGVEHHNPPCYRILKRYRV